MKRFAWMFCFVVLGWGEAVAQNASLRGSRASMARQWDQAAKHDYTYIRDRSQLISFVENDYLVEVPSGRNYRLHQVRYPYARPEVRTFLERLAAQYRNACGEVLVVTSLTRPRSFLLSNASPKSVHQTGMAVDLRRSNNSACRGWLERVLIQLESRGVLEATRERRPPHYHIALFPKPYARYVERLTLAAASRRSGSGADSDERPVERYRVRAGDSLWGIARRHQTTVRRIQQENNLSSNAIMPGQVLRLPGSGRSG